MGSKDKMWLGAIPNNWIIEIAQDTEIPYQEICKVINWEKEAAEAETFVELRLARINFLFCKDQGHDLTEAFEVISNKLEKLLLAELEEADSINAIKDIQKKYELISPSCGSRTDTSEVFKKINQKWDEYSQTEVKKARNIDDLKRACENARLDSEPRKEAVQKIFHIYKKHLLATHS